jgi:hypothetical protein
MSQLAQLRPSPSSVITGLQKRIEERCKLCSTCSKLEIGKRLAQSVGRPPSKWTKSFSACEVAANQSCPFCKLLWTLSQENTFWNGNPRPGSVIHVSLSFDDTYSIVGDPATVYIPCLKVESQENIQLVEELNKDRRQGHRESLFRLRKLEPYVDIGLIRDWLCICEENHDSCRKSTHRETKHSIRLIDVNKRCVINAIGNCKYAALSYVWGGREVQQLKLEKHTAARFFQEGGLSSSHKDIPSTIEDAMTVCSLLKMHYLWVDALCIEQDNKEDQDRQINQMDKIYANAYFTIVAAGILGDDSWSGLPGVNQHRNPWQSVGKVDGMQLASTAPHFAQAMDVCQWNTRAWTLQEMYFSRRLIYFAEAKVFFQCIEALWREDQILETDNSIRIHGRDSLQNTLHLDHRQLYKQNFDIRGVDSFGKYCRFVSALCSRVLTNPGDILLAFTGISNDLSESMDCKFVWGMPTAFFDHALLFENLASRPTRRRLGFPSWSWAGWQELESTHRTYLGPQTGYSEDEDIYQVYSEVDWYLILEGQHVKIDSSGIPKASSLSALDAIRLTWRPSQIESLSLSRLPPLVTGLTTNEQDTLLVLQTSCAFLDTEADSSPGGLFNSILSADGTKRPINLRGGAASAGRGIRRVLPPGSEVQKVEFIVLGTFALKSGVKREKSYTEKGYLKLMAIETDDKGISQRIGIVNNKVYVEEWVAYNPKWRTVYLL